jgi:hypothetical protein
MVVSKMNVHIDIMGELSKIDIPTYRQISRSKIIESIKSTLFDDEVKVKLIEVVNSYPDAALSQFLSSKYNILTAILKKRESIIEDIKDES